jgi:hypothetical protein
MDVRWFSCTLRIASHALPVPRACRNKVLEDTMAAQCYSTSEVKSEVSRICCTCGMGYDEDCLR